MFTMVFENSPMPSRDLLLQFSYVWYKFLSCHQSLVEIHNLFFVPRQNAPVVARAALLLECCHFVYRCNHGDWPEWMKSGRSYQRGRVSSNVFSSRTMGSCYRKNASLQRMAAKMFYLWAEVLLVVNRSHLWCDQAKWAIRQPWTSNNSICKRALSMLKYC